MESPHDFDAVHWDHEPGPGGRNLFGVPPSGGPNRLKPGLRTVGSWKAPTRFFARIGTMNRSVGRNLFGVPPSGGPDRPKPGLQTVGSWRGCSRANERS